MISLIISSIVILVLSIWFINTRYDPTYRINNLKRDPCNFRLNSYYVDDYYYQHIVDQEPGFEIIDTYNYDKDQENIISYSLYGNNPKYFDPAIRNIIKLQKKLPQWVVRIYLHENVGEKFRNKLVETGSQVFIVRDPLVKPGNSSGMFWRFLPLCENVNCVIYDADEEITQKKIDTIVKFFSQNKKQIRTAWTWPWPTTHICGGIIYKKKELKLPITQHMIKNYPHRTTFGSDEIFLTLMIGDKLNKNIWQQSNDMQPRWYSHFVRDHVIK